MTTIFASSPIVAYQTAAARADGGGGGESFATLLGQAASGAVQLGHAADTEAAAALQGHANLTDVVTALSKAELALQTTTAIRDRMISAYQDVMKMAI